MSIRWRLAAFLCQVAAVVGLTRWIGGTWGSAAPWYASLIALAVNRQLLEPFFPRPVDVLANSVVGLLLFALAPKVVAGPGWRALAVVLFVAAILSGISLMMGAGRKEGRLVPLARASRLLSGAYTSAFIYSALFWLGLLDDQGGVSDLFWQYAIVWFVVLAIGAVNWQMVWTAASRRSVPAQPEGLVGPTRLLVAGSDLPPKGATVTVSGAGRTSTGTVLTRIRRLNDVWAAIHIDIPEACEELVAASALTIADDRHAVSSFLGSVEANSTNSGLVFAPTRPLSVGCVVSVLSAGEPVLYQLTRAEVVDIHVKGGGHLVTQARAMQLGELRQSPTRLVRHRWVPDPGTAVTDPPEMKASASSDSRFLLGWLIGTKIPIYLDGAVLCEGHLAILGMTRMGKTTLAVRLAKYLGQERTVIVLDQTGEYRARQGFAAYDSAVHDATPGVSVCEPPAGRPVPDAGLEQLKHLANKGYAEYKVGTPKPRVLLVDEAHQFVPEPALLGFNAPGRDSAVQFGMYAMQVRKYGLTLSLISQRTAVVAKSALSQCENIIAFKSVDQTGLDYLEAVLGPQARDILPNLQQGEALVCGPAVSSDYPVAIRLAVDTQLPVPVPVTPTASSTSSDVVSDDEGLSK